MQLSFVRLKVDPKLVVQKRLPLGVRKQQLREQKWQEEVDTASSRFKTPGVVVQIAQAAKKKRTNAQLWTNLLGQALESRGEMTPQDMASVLWSMSEARFRHDGVIDDFVTALSYRSDVKAVVTAMLAVDRLGLPTESLRGPFLQHLTGQCGRLNLGDLRRVLLALARCWHTAPLYQQALLEELCSELVIKSENCDPRELIAVPQHLGRLSLVHSGLLSICASATGSIVSSRLSVLPLDVLRALDGWLLLKPLLVDRPQVVRDRAESVATKCRLLAVDLLRLLTLEEVWDVGSQLLGVDVTDPRVWSVWANEVIRRQTEEVGLAKSVTHVRTKLKRLWGLKHTPVGLDAALRSALQSTRVAGQALL
eukprot:TRINITY_DN10736_c0_g4_i1.p1 TRINITY_DN10736_c0_g4~~TRINITY_DN10736_c0_g4_i1.p1  ORF type:complete len:366 (+),score=57.74 TRINITY_DN10736_c0_g4_i1:132-1229(+)